ncbi:MAG: hypothetical protein COA88_04475 [Kordia sp.]|nr:MAG: hypothetical protein COA88_04475 [Kordia sp.]
MKKIIYLFGIVLISFSCSTDSDDVTYNPLFVAESFSPLNNSVCEGTITVYQNGIEVLFSWGEFSSNPLGITYTLTLTDLGTNTIQTIVVENGVTSTLVVLEPNTAYEWTVTATNAAGDSIIGATGQFHTPYEASTNYTPFPATLNTPVFQATVAAGNVVFDWSGNDPDTGETATLTYDLYLGTTNPPVLHTATIATMNSTVSLPAGTYYWFIKSKDVNGNASYSSTRTFTVQ